MYFLANIAQQAMRGLYVI